MMFLTYVSVCYAGLLLLANPIAAPSPLYAMTKTITVTKTTTTYTTRQCHRLQAPTSIAAPPTLCSKPSLHNLQSVLPGSGADLWIQIVRATPCQRGNPGSTFPKTIHTCAVAVPMHAQSNLSLLSLYHRSPLCRRCPNACQLACLPKTYPLKPFAQQSGKTPCNQFLRQQYHQHSHLRHDISTPLEPIR